MATSFAFRTRQEDILSFEELERGRHPNKCDNSHQPAHPKPAFPYCKFENYLSVKFYNEKQERRRSLVNQECVHNIDDFTDDVLKEEFTAIYGPCDQSSIVFQKVFNTYKEERLEQISEWCLEEASFISEIQNTLPNEGSERVIDVEKTFCDDLELFQSISQSATKLQPFLLPKLRKTESQILNDYLFERKELKSLVDYDPEVQINSLIIPEICNIKVGDRLADRIVTIIKRHSTGIANTQFLTDFKKKLGYFPGHQELGYLTYADMMSDLGTHLVFIQDFYDHDSIYYPICLKDLMVTPKNMFFNIWHKLKIAVSLNSGIVKLNKAVKLCSNVFGWSTLDFTAWGFDTLDSFIQFLITYFGDEAEFKIVPETSFNLAGREHVKYLMMIENSKQQHLLSSSCSSSSRILKQTCKQEKPQDNQPNKEIRRFPSQTQTPKTARGRNSPKNAKYQNQNRDYKYNSYSSTTTPRKMKGAERCTKNSELDSYLVPELEVANAPTTTKTRSFDRFDSLPTTATAKAINVHPKPRIVSELSADTDMNWRSTNNSSDTNTRPLNSAPDPNAKPKRKGKTKFRPVTNADFSTASTPTASTQRKGWNKLF